MPIRKRKPVELRPSESNSMKRRHPEFGFHKNYIHPWSIFQKGCALQYRQLTNRQRQQLQLIQSKRPALLQLIQSTGPLLLKGPSGSFRFKFKKVTNELLKGKKTNNGVKLPVKPSQNPTKYKKGYKLNGYEVTMKTKGLGKKKVWTKIK